MRKIIRVTTMLMALCLFWMSALPVSAETTTAEETTTVAETTTVEEKTTAEEKTTERETTPAEDTETEAKTTETPTTKMEKIYVSIKNKGVASAYASPIYIYTGKPIKPTVTVTKSDGTEVDKSDYTIEYTGDCINPGNHGVMVVYKKNGYTVEAVYQIIPGTTDKINVKVKNGQVTVSWNPVPGAGVYRVYKYNKETGGYSEMWWSADEIASPKTSRTFTSKELKPGGKYKMAIMALPAINWMPTDQMAYFTVDTTKDTDTVQKPTTTAKPVEKTTLIAPQPTTVDENGEVTTVKEETMTVPETEKSVADVFDEPENNVSDNDVEEEKDSASKIKLIIILIIVPLAIAGIIFSLLKKKK